MDSIGESINSICVVERLSTKSIEKNGSRGQGCTVVNVGIGLDNPDQFFAGVIEIELDLVTGTSDRFITSKLHLFEKVFVGVLCHLATFISVQEYIVDVQRCRNKGLLVGGGGRDGRTIRFGKGRDSPQAFTNRTDIKIDFDFVILYITVYPTFRYI